MGQTVVTLHVPLFAEKIAEETFAYVACRVWPANERSFCLCYKAHRCELQEDLCTPHGFNISPQLLEPQPPIETKHSYMKSPS